LPGFGAPAGWAAVAWMFLNPRADAGRGQPAGGAGRSQGRRQVVSEGRARRVLIGPRQARRRGRKVRPR